MNAQAHCAEPYGSPIDVPGAQNVPQPGGGHGDPAAGVGADPTSGGAHHKPPAGSPGSTPPGGPAPLPALPLTAPPPLSSLAQILLP